MAAIAVCIEAGARRTFASALDWPGWARAGKTEEAALEALARYAERYRAAVDPKGFPKRISFDVVERIKGDATTDFGAPGKQARADAEPLTKAGVDRLVRIIQANWSAFDETVEAARGVTLATGPRGGGRALDKIVAHVQEAEAAYLAQLGEPAPKDGTLRQAVVAALGARARGEPWTRKTKKVWPPRYAARRIAWHVLDHAWEIQDRAR